MKKFLLIYLLYLLTGGILVVFLSASFNNYYNNQVDKILEEIHK